MPVKIESEQFVLEEDNQIKMDGQDEMPRPSILNNPPIMAPLDYNKIKDFLRNNVLNP